MINRTFHAPEAGPLTFDLTVGHAEVTITVSPVAAAVAELSGPDDVVNEAWDGSRPGRWSLTLPAPAPTVISTGGVQVVNYGGGQVIQADTIYGGITMVNGRMQVGMRMTDAVMVPGPEPVRLDVTVPPGSRLTARVESGTLTTRGILGGASISGTSLCIEVDSAGNLSADTISGRITAGSVTGAARLSSTSGRIRVGDAAGPVAAETISGGIDITTSAPVTIDAGSVSGDITVHTGGADPDVRAHSVSGRTRITR
jgi:hypothetical protein